MPKRIPPSNSDTQLKVRFGATIRQYRKTLGVSQEELAWRAEMHRTYLADVERGVRNLSLSSIARLVSAIGVPLSEFFGMLERVDVNAVNAGRRGAAPRGKPARKQPKAKTRARRRGGR